MTIWKNLFGEDLLETSVRRAVALLKEQEPEEGYYGAFSGGKDSCVIKALSSMAGCGFAGTWNQPKMNMFYRIEVAPKVPPTRMGRWCCEEYKEIYGGKGGVKIFGVRAAESPKRRHNWREVSEDLNGEKVVCPIVFWPTDLVWRFLRRYEIPYCSLYDEGWDRLGCVGCPLASQEKQKKEFQRWPHYEKMWRRAIIRNWERWHSVPTEKGKPRYHAKFVNGEAFYLWWRTAKPPEDVNRECQSGILWTNEELPPEDGNLDDVRHPELLIARLQKRTRGIFKRNLRRLF